jgi:hypothetical protein
MAFPFPYGSMRVYFCVASQTIARGVEKFSPEQLLIIMIILLGNKTHKTISTTASWKENTRDNLNAAQTGTQPIGNNQKEIIDGDSIRRPKGAIQGVQNHGENVQGSCVAFSGRMHPTMSPAYW